jgi:hypothetical protein
MGKASEAHAKAHAAFTARDWELLESMMTPECVYEDHARGLTMKDRSGAMDWLRGWTAFMSDAEPADAEYIDGGSYSVARFTGRGTNDGPFGPFEATGKRLALPFCEILHWTDDGCFDHGEIYYDQVSMMVQLGHMEPPPAG